MERILLSTDVYREPVVVFEAITSFEDYPAYASHLDRVAVDGDGGVGTAYELHFSWWKLTYAVHSTVTEVEPPTRLGWRLTEDLDAAGEWRLEPISTDEGDAGTRLFFEATYDPHTADPDAISLPRFVSLGWVIDRVRPKLYREAERVLERLVADIEGEPRDIQLTVHETPE